MTNHLPRDRDHILICTECHFPGCHDDCEGCRCDTAPMGAPCAHCEQYPASPEPWESEPQWVSRKGWGLSHVLNGDRFTLYRNEYVKTLCGRDVRADQVTAAGYEDRCKTCGRRTES